MGKTSASLDGERRANLGDSLGRSVLDSLDVALGRVELLVLARFAGEEDQAGLVGLQAVNVGGEGFLGVV